MVTSDILDDDGTTVSVMSAAVDDCVTRVLVTSEAVNGNVAMV